MRPKNIVNGESFAITVTDTTYELLEQLCACGYGRSVPDAAGEIVSAEVRRLVISGELDKLLARRRTPFKEQTGDAGQDEKNYPTKDE